MKFYKLLFLSFTMMGSIISVSSYSWMSMWMGLEINLLSIIPLFSNSKNMMSTESSMKYFMTQAMASMVFLMAIIMLSNQSFMSPPMNSSYMMMMNTALLTKMGAAPFHFWLPEVIEGLTWMNSILILTWQKIAPMILLSMNSIKKEFLIIVIIISAITSTIMAFNQLSLRKIMAYSSINHMAWMLTSLMMSMKMWLMYFIVYSAMNISIISIFMFFNTFYLNQMNMWMNKKKMSKIMFSLMFLSLGGLPPFIGFMPKWIIVNWMIMNKLNFLTFILILTAIVMLFIYMRMMMNYFMFSYEPKFSSKIISDSMISNYYSSLLSSLILSSLIPLIF